MVGRKILISLIALLLIETIQAKDIVRFSPNEGDFTSVVRQAIEKAESEEIKLIFEKGVYSFKPDLAFEQYMSVTNHENGYKKIIFPFQGFKSVEVEGNGSEFIFSGQVMPFLFSKCGQVSMSGLNIDWSTPFTFQGEVVAINPEEGWREIKPFTDGFSWKLNRGQIEFPLVDGFKFSCLGSTLAFDPVSTAVSYDAKDIYSKPTTVERMPNGNLRVYEKLKKYPAVGSILNSKGPKGENRYAPAIHVISSSNINIDRVVIHHALGMGFLAERSDTFTLTNSGVYVREGSDRVVSIIADATHFCNMKGHVLIENCRFEHMLDDGTNVHGTYVTIDKVLNDHQVRISLEHFQQTGFEFADQGDELWFIHEPSPDRMEVNTVMDVKVINSKYSVLTFKNKLQPETKKGDVLENKTWNPTFTMRGCTIQNHRARNIVLKSPLKTIIENNTLSSMMASILFRGETYYWFESGQVGDVLIRNNTFIDCVQGGSEQAVFYVTPRLGKHFNSKAIYDRNIVIEDNNIRTFNNRIVWADRTAGIVIRNNDIVQTKDLQVRFPEAPTFQFDNCEDILIEGNTYIGDNNNMIRADEKSSKSIKIKKNKGIH
ncbi:alpha-1,3-galactosidase-related protein [Reichenbachiella versicolor]|uniref:alpha-1,3-galactosidase-related protein n=1 Tax=Reichenbachiella versicolor TaxID=1821036 RepID=UPI001C87A591|nr:hypothetical protein [Reichenbachiella versicolor]